MNNGSLNYRAQRYFSRSEKAAGECSTAGLGSVQSPERLNERTRYQRFFPQRGRYHAHSWIPGADIEVCTLCGATKPKGAPDEEACCE